MPTFSWREQPANNWSYTDIQLRAIAAIAIACFSEAATAGLACKKVYVLLPVHTALHPCRCEPTNYLCSKVNQMAIFNKVVLLQNCSR